MNTTAEKLAGARLYGIVDLGYLAEEDLEQATGALLAGGVDLLQLRAKSYDESRSCALATRLLPLCRDAGVPLIVNDFVRVARDSGADGVHLGQEDGSLDQARAQLDPGAVVGRSTHSPAQARAALAEGADYIGFGPLYPTPTKLGRPGIGLEDLAAVQGSVGGSIPVFCIGGVKLGNLAEVLAAGARRVVIVSGLLQAADITARTREVRNVLEEVC